ncbi:MULTISPECIES: asparaginase [Caproicibacterium]|uniref:asparaginase n=1 Tax=Caproicibacterium argilliputei TaxID=3030016 RepID=A0AA97H2D3_9FIRM|nr:asparaginase [Caproicibacterium argilliputei]WOC33541.1 asparaginase [Caproicibacterium argilliputei]
MKRILLIATGGTIASRKTNDGLVPQLSPEELLSYVPEAQAFCQIDTRQVLNLDSTNIQPQHWLLIADTVRTCYDTYDGFVICHGTDTMAYTAAALSYLIRGSAKPIVVTGSQKPIDMDVTDAKTNLEDSLRWASAGEPGVCIVFGGRVIAGTRARKIRSKSYNAFSSINFPELAVIRDGRIVKYMHFPAEGKPEFSDSLDTRVSALKLTPGLPAAAFSAVGQLCDGFIIESYGVGGVPDLYGEALAQLSEAGKTIVVATQVPHEGSDMAVYQVGHRAKERFGLLETYDMTLESTVTKLMWALAQTHEPQRVRKLFYTTINHDILWG